ncbi:MAG: MCP four helix bundle domain-containing protein, partial [Nitrososphaera sp.]
MKIRSKLLLSFSVIVGIVIVVGYLPVSSIWSVSSSFDHLRNESLPDVALRGQIESVANSMVIEVQQIVIDSITEQGQSDDEAQLNAHLYTYENHKETIYSLLGEQAKITDEPEATLQLEEAIN